MKFKIFILKVIILGLIGFNCNHINHKSSINEFVEKMSVDSCDSMKNRVDEVNNQKRFIKVDLSKGNIGGYWISLPLNYNKQIEWPVLVFFHGAGLLETVLDSINPEGPLEYVTADTGNPGEIKRFLSSNFIIVTPHLKGTGERFPARLPSWAKEVNTIDEILDTILNFYSGDKEKIYLTGLSLGGGACWLIPGISKHSIAAIVPVCGAPMGYFGETDPRPKGKISQDQYDRFNPMAFVSIPVWNTFNDKDGWPIRIFQQTAVREIENLGGGKFLKLSTTTPMDKEFLKHRRIFTSFNKSGHDAWTATYNSIEIYKWMLLFRNQNGKIIREF